ncbi:hypothetical protein TNCT_549181 [Trichonephila clavata]|uniref:Uncharacterized protein n=1 Tax=Trichonephila clavata TaxID=2740835 RepID=A0A8X6L4P6_TRICU|nr:hypothetical protein TNCT_549181 [Trichonephila clavata]
MGPMQSKLFPSRRGTISIFPSHSRLPGDSSPSLTSAIDAQPATPVNINDLISTRELLFDIRSPRANPYLTRKSDFFPPKIGIPVFVAEVNNRKSG